MIIGIIFFGILKKVRVYDIFLEGAAEGLSCCINIAAPLVGLVVAISMMRESGAVNMIARLISPLLNLIKMPAEVFPLALLRPISGSGSMAVVTDIFKNCGTDSASGLIASVMMGSTETTFYTLAVYFGAVKIKNTRHTLPAALCGDLTGIILSVIVTRWLLL